jgi:hypothetical protein
MSDSEDGRSFQEVLSETIWHSDSAAMHFLVWLGICSFPSHCTRGHPWEIWDRRVLCCTYFKLPVSRPLQEGVSLQPPKSVQCSLKATWRQPETFPKSLPASLQPTMLLRILFWFSQRSTPEAMASRCEGTAYSVSHSVSEIRNILRETINR